MQQRPRIVAVIGESGGGKSTVAVQLVAGDPRVLVAAPYMKNPYGALACATYGAAKATLRDVKPKKFRLAVPVYDKKGLAEMCRLAWVVAPVTLVLDETAFYIQNTAAAPEELRYIVQVGRHAGPDEEQPVSLVVLGQVPSNLPTWLRAEAKTVYMFPLSRDEDRVKVGADLGLPRETRELVDARLPTLPKYHRLRLDKQDDGSWTVHEGMGV